MSLLLSYWQGIRPNNDALTKEAEDVSANLLSAGKLGETKEIIKKTKTRKYKLDFNLIAFISPLTPTLSPGGRVVI